MVGAVLLAIMMGLNHGAASRFHPPFPPLSVSLSSPTARLSDFVGIAMGFRRLVADIAWVQTIVYYGTPEEGVTEVEVENGGGQYPLFLAYCERVTQLDPNFKYVYYQGGAALGWNLKRMDEAEKLLREGIQAHPKEWRFQQFLAGLAYQKNHNVNALTSFLEGFVEENDCPNLLRSILANIYKKQKRYRDSIRVWKIIYDSNDPNYQYLAVRHIQEMGLYTH